MEVEIKPMGRPTDTVEHEEPRPEGSRPTLLARVEE